MRPETVPDSLATPLTPYGGEACRKTATLRTQREPHGGTAARGHGPYTGPPQTRGLPCDSSAVYGCPCTLSRHPSTRAAHRYRRNAGAYRPGHVASLLPPQQAPLSWVGERGRWETPAVRPRRSPGRAYSGGRGRGAHRYGAHLRAAPGHSRWCSGSPGRVRARASPQPENHAPCLPATG